MLAYLDALPDLQFGAFFLIVLLAAWVVQWAASERRK